MSAIIACDRRPMADESVTTAPRFQRALSAFWNYIESDDPVQRACNVVAIIVVSNQPLYPLYVRYLAAPDNGVSMLTFLSTPLFAAVPAIARRYPTAGLAALPVIGLANGIVATLALGTPAGIELFIIPCVLIAVLVQSVATRLLILSATTIALCAYTAIWFLMGEPLHRFTLEQYVSLYRLNLFSVAGLTLYATISLILARRKRKYYERTSIAPK